MEKIPDTIHVSWHQYLQPLFDDDKMKMIRDEILSNCFFYPTPSNIFRVFSMPIDDIKVVILGQDPYPNGEANGLAFAVNEGVAIPKSLNIIFKEVIKAETPADFIEQLKTKDRTLMSWFNQGVFLLNTALTVEEKNAGSHLGIWQWFTREVIKIISQHHPCIWLLWGAKAQSYREFIHNRADHTCTVIDRDTYLIQETNYILEAPHPAAELYSGGKKTTFSGCNHFNLCNDILQLQNKQKINF